MLCAATQDNLHTQADTHRISLWDFSFVVVVVVSLGNVFIALV